MKKRVGIFGGTFNPPHAGHVSAAKAFIEKANLDSLIIMPAFIPPHKAQDISVSCEERLEMCKIAFNSISGATVSDLEISRGGTSYTYLTLQELADSETELYFLCGTDMILTMDLWKKPEIIFSIANICYIRRENDEVNTILIDEKCKEYIQKYGAKLLPINSDVIEISSSEIRNNPSEMKRYLSDELLDYIRKEGLYK